MQRMHFLTVIHTLFNMKTPLSRIFSVTLVHGRKTITIIHLVLHQAWSVMTTCEAELPILATYFTYIDSYCPRCRIQNQFRTNSVIENVN